MNISQEKRAEKINQGLEKAQSFTWEKCANETLKVLE